MVFEDPSKLKVDLVVESEDSKPNPTTAETAKPEPLKCESLNTAPVAQGVAQSPAQSPAQAPELSSTVSDSPSSDASLTPWKNRFVQRAPGKLERRARTIGSTLVDLGTIALAIFTIAVAALLLCTAHYGADESYNKAMNVCYSAPLILGFFLYASFVVRAFLAIKLIKEKERTIKFFRGIPIWLAANTTVTFGTACSIAMFLNAKSFVFVRGLEPTIGQQHVTQAIAALLYLSTPYYYALMFFMCIGTMMVVRNWFQWVERRTSELYEVTFGEKKAGLIGAAVGALFGICGVISSYSGGDRQTYVLSIATLIWAIGILIACGFFHKMRKLVDSKASKVP